jgi:hypothetical protein
MLPDARHCGARRQGAIGGSERFILTPSRKAGDGIVGRKPVDVLEIDCMLMLSALSVHRRTIRYPFRKGQPLAPAQGFTTSERVDCYCLTATSRDLRKAVAEDTSRFMTSATRKFITLCSLYVPSSTLVRGGASGKRGRGHQEIRGCRSE